MGVVEVTFDKCILCIERPNDSWEHVIPQSIGGRLKARLLCSTCNNKFGSDFVSALRSEPSIRIALEHLKDELHSDLYNQMRNGQLYVGKAEDGSIIKLVSKDGEPRILFSPGAQGSRNQDTRDAREALITILNRQGQSSREVDKYLALFDELKEDQPLDLPGHTFVKRHIPPLMPQLTAESMDERVPALIAYEFLSLLIGDLIYHKNFDEIRQYIRTGAISNKCSVQHLTSRKYAPFHAINVQPEETHFTIFIRFFRWLVFAVKFDGFAFRGPDAVYWEDLKQRQSIIFPTRSDARDGKGYLF